MTNLNFSRTTDSLRPGCRAFAACALLRLSLLSLGAVIHAEELPIVSQVEFQPLAAQVARVVQAFELIGEPLPAADSDALKKFAAMPNGGKAQVEEMQKILDKYALAGVDINPESRVKVQQGNAPPRLM
jgi:hypothetical protein